MGRSHVVRVGWAIAAIAMVPSAAVAPAATATSQIHREATRKHHKRARPHHKRLPAQRGGRVRHAWPAHGARGRPAKPLARWLARQVGPAPARRHKRHRRPLATAAAAQASVPFQNTGATQTLALVRSYAIPADDPAATRLANLSWTYDSAVSAVAFSESGLTTQAVQLLDQLKALQRSDGSIDFAFDTSNGQSIPQFRAGAIAWAGLAAVDYRATTCVATYDALAYGAAKWLLSEQVSTVSSPAYGLIPGGPDVTWASTQHNLVARAFLARLADAIDGKLGGNSNGNGEANGKKCPGGLAGLSPASAAVFSTQLHSAVALLDLGINRALYVRLTPATTGKSSTAGTAYLREGVGDDARPADAQALGALWLLGLGRSQDAQAVINYADQSMLLTNRSVALSSNPLTFNETYSSAGPFVGYRPYADPGSPEVLWMEGTLEMRYAKKALGGDTSTLDTSIAGWQAITGATSGPLQANRAVVGNVFNEYHPWPDASAGAWELLNITSFSLLSGA
jgi:hypothetical protein